MSQKIVFNGQEYDGVDAMPPEVRREYEAVLRMVRVEAGVGKLDFLVRWSPVRNILNITTTVQRRIVVNGKEFKGVDEMPAEVRAAYERALAQAGGGVTPAGDQAHSPPKAFRPPPLLEDDDRRGVLRRIATWVVIALLIALWLFRKSIPGQ